MVHVVDPVPSHVEAAAALDGVTAEVGDARALAAPDGSADVVLLLGPLYHPTDRRDRARALAEAVRTAHFHTAEELADDVRAAGPEEVAGYGVEGPAWLALDPAGLPEFDARAGAALRCARVVERDPAMVNASAHLLAIARTVSPAVRDGSTR